MDKLLTPLQKAESSWNTKSLYYYWLNIDTEKEKVCGILEMGGLNVPDKQMKTMQRMICKLKPSDKKRDDFKYKRVFHTKWISTTDDPELAVKQVVNELIDNEKELIKALS